MFLGISHFWRIGTDVLFYWIHNKHYDGWILSSFNTDFRDYGNTCLTVMPGLTLLQWRPSRPTYMLLIIGRTQNMTRHYNHKWAGIQGKMSAPYSKLRTLMYLNNINDSYIVEKSWNIDLWNHTKKEHAACDQRWSRKDHCFVKYLPCKLFRAFSIHMVMNLR